MKGNVSKDIGNCFHFIWIRYPNIGNGFLLNWIQYPNIGYISVFPKWTNARSDYVVKDDNFSQGDKSKVALISPHFNYGIAL